jgi:hypothetical protein
MSRIAFAVLDTSSEAGDRVLAARARSLTVSSLRWGYFGDILEGVSVDQLLSGAQAQGYDYCFIQSYGHTVAEKAGPHGARTSNFFDRLRQGLPANDFLITGTAVATAEGGYGLLSRCLLVDLRRHREFGAPPFGASLSRSPAGARPVAKLRPDEAVSAGDRTLPGAALVAASLARGIPVAGFGADLDGFLVDFGSDLSGCPQALAAWGRQADAAPSGVFVLNYESYRDVEEPPDGFRPPISALYSVAAGLKPNRILHTHGFDLPTRIVFFDYSERALEFRRVLLSDWTGRDYPGFLRRLFHSLDPTTHYYLWPGARRDALDWTEMERLWKAEIDRWGGEEIIAEHWARYRLLPHRFVLCNLLTSWSSLLAEIEDDAGAVIWWSNAFCTTYSAWCYTLEEKQRIYGDWIQALAAKAPRAFVYGSDHSNSSVNCISAGDYYRRYLLDGGDPLRARSFYRHEMRF